MLVAGFAPKPLPKPDAAAGCCGVVRELPNRLCAGCAAGVDVNEPNRPPPAAAGAGVVPILNENGVLLIFFSFIIYKFEFLS